MDQPQLALRMQNTHRRLFTGSKDDEHFGDVIRQLQKYDDQELGVEYYSVIMAIMHVAAIFFPSMLRWISTGSLGDGNPPVKEPTSLENSCIVLYHLTTKIWETYLQKLEYFYTKEGWTAGEVEKLFVGNKLSTDTASSEIRNAQIIFYAFNLEGNIGPNWQGLSVSKLAREVYNTQYNNHRLLLEEQPELLSAMQPLLFELIQLVEKLGPQPNDAMAMRTELIAISSKYFTKKSR